MKQYPIWKAIFMSFYSSELYNDIGRNWKGFGFLYLLCLSAVICTLIMGSWFYKIQKIDIDEYADKITKELFESNNLTFEENLNRILNIAAQAPKTAITNGLAQLDEDQPYFIKDPLTSNEMAIFDTTGKFESLSDTTAYLLLTKTSLILKNEAGEDVIYLSNIEKEAGISEEEINTFLNTLSQIPLIKIENGTASIGEQSPYFIYGKNGKKVAIIDTSGKTTSLETEDAAILLTADKLLIKNPMEKKVTEVNLSDLNADLVFEALSGVMSKLRTMLFWMLPLIITPLFTLASFIFTGIMIMLYGLCAMALARVFKLGNFSYEQSVRLCAVAITPVIFINTVVPHVFANQGLIYFLIAIGYIYFALRSNSQEQETPANQ